MDKHTIKLLVASLVLFGVVVLPATASAHGPGHGAAKARGMKHKPVKRAKAGLKAEELRKHRAIRERARDTRIEEIRTRHSVKHDAVKARPRPAKPRLSEKHEARRRPLRGLRTCADPRVVRILDKKHRHEAHKHKRRLAKLDRLAEIARETNDDKLLGKVGMLREKELTRHERAERRRPLCLKAPAPKPEISLPGVLPKELYRR